MSPTAVRANACGAVALRHPEHGWEVLIADRQKVKGLAPLARETDLIDARCWPSCPGPDPVPAI